MQLRRDLLFRVATTAWIAMMAGGLLLASTSAQADESRLTDPKFFSGHVSKVQVKKEKIEIIDGKGLRRSLKAPKDVPVTINGEKAKLKDLKKGLRVKIQAEQKLGKWVAVKITARRKVSDAA